MAKKKFKGGPATWTRTILDDGDVIGHIRVKPSTLMWKPKGKQKGTKPWFGVSMKKFAKYAKNKNKKYVK